MLVIRSPEEEAIEEDSGTSLFQNGASSGREMDLLQKNRRLQCLNVPMEVESMVMLMNNLQMERLELLK